MDMTQEPQPTARDRLYKAILAWHLTPSLDNREALKVAVDAVCGQLEVPQPVAAPQGDPAARTNGPARFTRMPSSHGVYVIDNDFDCDARLSIDGDFEDVAQREWYISIVLGLLNAPQPAAVPLTEQQITKCWGKTEGTRNGYGPFAEAVIAEFCRVNVIGGRA